MVLAGLFPVALRLLLIPWMGVPTPGNIDEFVHFLVADTISEGRLANPPHQHSIFFETISILQHPTYSAIYPLGQGTILSLGLSLGHPWIAILITGFFAGAGFFYFISAFTERRVAFLGSLAAGAKLLSMTYWMSSYMGGPLTAGGSCLALGGIYRWVGNPTIFNLAICGSGCTIVFLVRPFESIPLVILCVIGLITGMMRTNNDKRLSTAIHSISAVLPFVAIVTGITAAHNYAVTGDATLLPYRLSQSRYGIPQGFAFQAPLRTPPNLTSPQLKSFEAQQIDRELISTWHGFLFLMARKLWINIAFYFGIILIALIIICFEYKCPAVLWNSLATFAFLSAPHMAYAITPPHYIATTAPVVALIISVTGIQFCKLLESQWNLTSWKRSTIVFLVVIGGLVEAGLLKFSATDKQHIESFRKKAEIEGKLREARGYHLVFVHYGTTHNFGKEWVYNRAMIDAAPVVWARDISPEINRTLINYYPKRIVWIVNPDCASPTLQSYSPQVRIPRCTEGH